MKRISNILIVLSLLLLTGFLGYWLYYNYQAELESLVNKQHFNLAKALLEEADIDFEGLLKQIYDNPLLEGQDQKNTQFRVLYSEDANMDSLQINVLKQNQIFNTNTASEDSFPSNKSKLKVMSTLQTTSLDSFSVENAGLEQRVSDIDNIKQDLKRKAFFNIFPQIGFAILLLSMTMLAIWVTKHYYQKNQLLLENKNQFISNMAHELRTPVTTVGVALEAIENTGSFEKQARVASYLTTSRKEIKRLGHLIEQVLNIAKGELESNALSFQEMDLKLLVKIAIQSMQPQIDAKQAKIHYNFPTNPVFIHGDQIHLLNVVTNLIDNALKYNSNGLTLDFELEQSNGYTHLIIQDDGVGIPKRYQARLFEQFYRVPTGDQHNIKGYGLGLSYVQQIVTAHQGKVSLKSKANQGTSITIQLPNVKN